MNNNFAYVTLVTKEHYIKGARNLYLSLKRVKTQYPLIVLVTQDLIFNPNINIYQELAGTIIKIIPRNNFLQLNQVDISHSKLGDQRDLLNKLYIFELCEYDALCFLDADILVKTKDIDNIFKKSIYPIYGIYFPKGKAIDPDGISKKRAIGSFCFLIHPTKGIYNTLLEAGVQKKENNEEVVLTKLFPSFADHPEYHLDSAYADKLFYHDGWTTSYPKYWTWVDIDERWFLQLTDKEMNFFCTMLNGIGVNFHKHLYINKLIDESFQNTDAYINYRI